MSNKQHPTVIGIYGVSGSGKSHLLNQLEATISCDEFVFYEGSERIEELVPGGLAKFQHLSEADKTFWRQRSIDSIAQDCKDQGKAAVVAGHCMFWPEGRPEGQPVYTDADLRVYTHIFYLKVEAHELARRRRSDVKKSRCTASVEHLQRWQEAEMSLLQDLCRQNKILLGIVSDSSQPPFPTVSRIAARFEDANTHTESYNCTQIQTLLDRIVLTENYPLETTLVMDADRTLTSSDTGTLFWRELAKRKCMPGLELTLKDLFSSSMGYAYTAFRQATFLYEDAVEEDEFEEICSSVAAEVMMHPEFLHLLRLSSEEKHVGAIVVTCGVRRVWETVIEREGLSERVKVIGGGRISDGVVVNAKVKADIVRRLREQHNQYVWAFGDSPLDLDMLRAADKAMVVVGEEQVRSHTMEDELSQALEDEDFRPRQICLPYSSPPRLDTERLPAVTFNSAFMKTITAPRVCSQLHFIQCSDEPGTKVLATAMRDGPITGPTLREAHRRVGYYLAIRFVTNIVGIEDCPIRHVLGHSSTGSRLLDENQTLIVAAMRAGEPMAYGVHDAFPKAMFCHAKKPQDIDRHHMEDVATVILVDAVINTGKTIVEFVERIRSLHAGVRIVIVTGVVQDQVVAKDGILDRKLGRSKATSLISLRLSKTRFTGTKGTDTGNRLFNTTNLA